MVIPVHCVDCGRKIGEIDTDKNKNMHSLDAPCGDKVCKACCKICWKEAEQRGEPCQKVKKDAV